MSQTSLDEFLKFTSAEATAPLLNFYWSCVSLPGLDVKYVESVSFPFPHLNLKEGLFGAGTFSYYPGFEDISAFDITFYEDSNLTVTKWLKSWVETIRDPNTGAYALPDAYKQDIIVELHDTKGAKKATGVLNNVWPVERGNWDLLYSGGGDRLTIQQNFSIDNLNLSFE